MILNESPDLFGKEAIIECFHISKVEATIFLTLTQTGDINPIDFVVFLIVTPPETNYRGLNTLGQLLR